MDGSPAPALIADIGGTHIRLAMAADGVPGPSVTWLLDGLPDAATALAGYLRTQPRQPRTAVLAVAGPVEATADGGRATLTNRGWPIDAAALRRALDLDAVRLVNDFAALGHALPALRGDDLLSLGGGPPESGAPAAVLGPGTGLGVALRVAGEPGRPGRVLATEGGHASLAAGTAREAAVIAALRPRFGGHVSNERALSGPGLENLRAALAAVDGVPVEPLAAAEIAARGEAGNCPMCREALTMFCALLGSFAGDLALLYGARAGVFVAGGIPPRIAAFLAASDFRARFEAKGRFRAWLTGVPSWLVLRPDAAMLGLATLAVER